ncbi:thermonuclease family protein [Thiococcus pfennigii]|jgi:endonuclease YncB( thermonuclease family)|uniref:thermonuclease family protein n=1 Tax=Thiococcus pfennigii TaxID=1057 RepID=UPI001903C473|nr:nuclease-like protein [Thiococcus pfennigii]MBK1700012.1 nuclease-like protein [Thiococcus pfennigii]MBK1731083.1 nuclease-like protein [Thiococcus pfennigii]
MRLWRQALLVVATLSFAASAAARELVGHAHVRDDGSLRIRERVVHLYGLYIPETSRQCREWIRPVRCAERAVLALDFIVRGFVHCAPQFERADGSLEAICHVDRTSFDPGTDLGAYLIEQGWALARPEAPFEYQALERIARARGRGVWGEPVDVIRDRRRD